jgi:rubrerythrin
VSTASRRREDPVRGIVDVTGTRYAMWRCGSCGEMGRLRRTLPATCPGCDGGTESLFYWAED